MDAQPKPKTSLQIWADSVERCLNELERHNHTPLHISITPTSSVVFIRKAPGSKVLPAKICGELPTENGLYWIMEFWLYGVRVQYLKLNKSLVDSPGVH